MIWCSDRRYRAACMYNIKLTEAEKLHNVLPQSQHGIHTGTGEWLTNCNFPTERLQVVRVWVQATKRTCGGDPRLVACAQPLVSKIPFKTVETYETLGLCGSGAAKSAAKSVVPWWLQIARVPAAWLFTSIRITTASAPFTLIIIYKPPSMNTTIYLEASSPGEATLRKCWFGSSTLAEICCHDALIILIWVVSV